MCSRSFAVIAGFLALVSPSCSNSDNLALLLDTLKPVHRSVCDDKPVSLACPTGTTISILVAQYGDSPDSSLEACDGMEVDRSCKLPNKLQYMLLQRVVEACQKKPSCKFDTNPGPDDPCPNSRKFVEVSYKCRPFEFRSLHACNDELVRLSCNPHSRIAIYSAIYGRVVYDEVTCQQPQGVPEESCSTPYALETVMRICHGKRRCQFTASRNTFDTSCKPYTKPYAKIIYACVPLGVLTKRYESPLGKDEMSDNDGAGITDESLYDGDGGERWREPYPFPPYADPALQSTTEATTTPAKKNGVSFKPTNKENENVKNSKIFIYVGVGLIITILIGIIVIIVRCYFTKKAKEIAKNGEMFTAEAPNVFNDAASDVDNDVEISHISGTFYDPVHPDMILYRDVDGTRNTLRAMRPLSTVYPCAGPRMYGNVDLDYIPPKPREFGKFARSRSKEEPEPELMTSPKSLGAYSTSQFYYG